ncbi:MAG TPA: protein phosphatase 2C domain-containing protein [Terracidiphilus sp.]|nr:protein phosphatase 2C domain-containing protein [Terracidiphilus sp.]
MQDTCWAVRPNYEAAFLSSPARGEDADKDQDRTAWDSQRLIACVCDGLTTSPYSAKAAEHLCLRVPEIMAGPQDAILPALRTIRDELLEMREQSMRNALVFDEAIPLVLHEVLSSVAMRGRQLSFQSTLGSIRITETQDGARVARVLWCGDTGIFAFRQDGELVWSNLELAAAGQLEHRSITPCLPDCLDNARLLDLAIGSNKSSTLISEDASFLVASDGFYTAFPNCYEMWTWLNTYRRHLCCGGAAGEKDAAVQALHQGLIGSAGDDDISFVFVFPIQPAKGRE